MKILAKFEEAAGLLLSVYLFSLLAFDWWVYPVLFFVPDASMLGLLAGRRAGAVVYNLVHHKAVAVATYMAGGMLGIPLLALGGVILLGHSSFDRVLGFGLLDGTEPVVQSSTEPTASVATRAGA
jgi:hypothetical protein